MTYYDVLGVPVTATQGEIKAAYIAQIKFFHPDVFTGPPEVAKVKSAQLNEAYSVLSSPEKRRIYDKTIPNFTAWTSAKANDETTAAPEAPDEKADCQPSPPRYSHDQEQRQNERLYRSSKATLINVLVISAVIILVLCISAGVSRFSPQPSATESQPLPQVLPGSGKILDSVFYRYDAPLTIETRGDGYYLVKLKDKYSHRDVCSVFVYGGRSVNIDVDFGCYELYYAHGDTWYGEEFLFGSDTKYYKADDDFLFEEYGDYVYGWTVELYFQDGGNLAVSTIDGSEF